MAQTGLVAAVLYFMGRQVFSRVLDLQISHNSRVHNLAVSTLVYSCTKL